MDSGKGTPSLSVGAGPGGFAQVRSAWDGLSGRATYFFQTPGFIEPYARGVDDDVVWIAAADGTHPAAALVLRRTTRKAAGIKFTMLRRAQIGEAGLYYGDGLLDRAAFGERPLRELLDGAGPWHLMRLARLRAHSPWLELFDGGLVTVEEDGGVGILDTSLPFDECWGSVTKNMRNSLRKSRRKISERGGSEIVVHTEGPELERAYDQFVALEASGWKAKEGFYLANMPVEGGLWRDYLLGAGNAQVRSLFVDGRLAAAQTTIRHERTLFLHRIAYEEELSDVSPSNILMADLIKACCDDPAIDRIDCMTWQVWNQRWGMSCEPTHSVVLFNDRTVRGLATRTAWRARARLRPSPG
jgi:CelD/BcsL family acetyltransferase involved in cellulose biosynthesis